MIELKPTANRLKENVFSQTLNGQIKLSWFLYTNFIKEIEYEDSFSLHDEKSKRKVNISMCYDGEECHTNYVHRDRLKFMKNKEMRHSDIIEKYTLILI
jgi:hypothetical protein